MYYHGVYDTYTRYMCRLLERLLKRSGVTLLEGARGQGMVRCPTD